MGIGIDREGIEEKKSITYTISHIIETEKMVRFTLYTVHLPFLFLRQSVFSNDS